MSKFKPLSKKEGMNALNTDFTQPGAGLQQAGVTLQNLNDKWGALYEDRNSKAGGSKQLWDNLSRWTTTKNAQHFAQTQPEQAALFNKSIQTGVIQPGLSTQTLSAALDWGVRENDRSQQHKENFLDTTFGMILGKLAQIGVGFIPGVGVPLAMTLAGGLGAAQAAAQTRPSAGSMALGGVSGALSGYSGAHMAAGINAAGGVGPYVSNIGASIKNGVSNLFGGGGFSNPAGLGLSGANLGLNFASGGFSAAPVAGYGIGSGLTAGGLGLTGANLGVGLTNSLGGAPIPGYGNSAVGGQLNTPGLINAPTPGSTPRSVMGPPSPGETLVDKGVKVAKAGMKIASALTPSPQQGGLMTAPMQQQGQGPQMVPHNVQMRPFMPYRYFGPTSNPFMARIT